MSYRPSYIVGDIKNPLISAPATPAAGFLKVYGDTTTKKLAYKDEDGLVSIVASKAYVDGILGANNAIVYKTTIDCSGNPNYPAADAAGWMWIISVAGKIGGASGIDVEVGDMVIANAISVGGTQAAVGTKYNIIEHNIVGAVTGPASSADGEVTLFNSTSGKVIKGSGIKISDSGTPLASVDTTIPTSKAVKDYVDGKSSTITANTYIVNATVASTDGFVAVQCSSADLTMTLPTAVGIAGKQYTFKKVDATAYKVIIDANGTETIDGALTQDIVYQYDTLTLIARESGNWAIM